MRVPAVLILLLGLCLGAQAPRHLTVAAAADLKWALEEVRQEFRQAQPAIQVDLTFGASGLFYAQLTQKAPFDLFLSADLDYPRRLQEAGLARGLFTYGRGRLALVVAPASALDPARLGLRTLLDPAVRHAALANPAHAPFGRAARSALEAAGLWAELQPKVVLGENVSQAAQFVQSGAAEAGLVALSLTRAPAAPWPAGRVWLVPAELHPPLDQGGAILAWAKDPGAAEAFRDFLLGPRGRAILARYCDPPK